MTEPNICYLLYLWRKKASAYRMCFKSCQWLLFIVNIKLPRSWLAFLYDRYLPTKLHLKHIYVLCLSQGDVQLFQGLQNQDIEVSRSPHSGSDRLSHLAQRLSAATMAGLQTEFEAPFMSFKRNLRNLTETMHEITRSYSSDMTGYHHCWIIWWALLNCSRRQDREGMMWRI